ncbi:MAG TPA: TonB-dependent receptor [Rhizomicrobium sp.]|jgi:outer membrane receptor protein involved in Fe transport
MLLSGHAIAQSQTYSFDIPAEPLSVALRDFARVSGQQIIFTDDLVAGKNAPGLHGDFSPEAALSQLLAGTNLVVERGPSGAVMVRRKNAQAASAKGAAHFEASGVEEVVVTGTHIEGVAPAGSKLDTYTRDDLDRSGAGTLDEFARQIPNNLSSTDPVSNVFSGAGLASRPGDANNNGGAAFNLGGLGTNSTLTLIDGHRVAASGDQGSFVDITMIPFGAVDHIEVLQDGSSSIYGSDAVAGVVNIIMKKDFDGAETQLRYGGATDGGADEFSLSQLVGKTWATGNALINYEYDEQMGLDASQRGYIPPLGGPSSLLPRTQRNSIFFTGNQDIDSDTTVSGEFLYSHKTNAMLASLTSLVEDTNTVQSGYTSQAGGEASINRKLGGDWQANLSGNYSAVTQSFGQLENLTVPGVFSETVNVTALSKTQTWGGDALANGTLFSLTGGDVKAAFGASYRAETYADANTETVFGATQLFPFPSLSRHVESVFGEAYVPIVDDANAMPFVRRLDLSVALRYDHYSDFGSTTNPKVGVVWGVTDDFSFRGTYGTSFRAPLLTELGTPASYFAQYLPNPAAPGGLTDTLYWGGGNPNLQPEKAKVFTVGTDWRPSWDPALQISATYSHIDYTNVIGLPPVTNLGAILTSPLLAPFINTHPSPAFVHAAFYSPGFEGDSTGLGEGGVGAIFDERDANLAAQRESSIDLRASYSVQSDFGSFVFNVAGDRFLENGLKTAPAAPVDSILNTFGEPPRLKGRGSITWANDGFTASFTVNYTNSYNDNLTIPDTRINSWTTADAYFGYALDVPDDAILRNLKLSLSILNLTDAKPPYVQIPAIDLLPGQQPVSFDPVNASPVGRLISLQVTKDF